MKKLKERDKKMGGEAITKKQFEGMRVVQKNLVYVIGIPLSVADEKILESDKYFGQYGPILKLAVNKKNVCNADTPHATVSCYITYMHNEDARRAIRAVDGIHLDYGTLRASYGTTKYCAFYLRNMTCPKKECMYLHEPGDQKESFTKEELSAG